MSDYHIVVNHDRREWLHPHRFGDPLDFDDGFKRVGGGILTGLAYLLKDDGAWSGDRVAIVGSDTSPELYELAMDSYKDVSFEVMAKMAEEPLLKRLLFNRTRWRRVEGVGDLLADADERAFYKELFNGMG